MSNEFKELSKEIEILKESIVSHATLIFKISNKMDNHAQHIEKIIDRIRSIDERIDTLNDSFNTRLNI